MSTHTSTMTPHQRGMLIHTLSGTSWSFEKLAGLTDPQLHDQWLAECEYAPPETAPLGMPDWHTEKEKKMDTRTGEFHDTPVPEEMKDHAIYFEKGETIIIKGHEFKVASVDVTLHHLILKSHKRFAVGRVAGDEDEEFEAMVNKLEEAEENKA